MASDGEAALDELIGDDIDEDPFGPDFGMPPPPPPPAPLRAASVTSTRGTADVTVTFPNGDSISYYRQSGKLQATCLHRHGPSCKLTRTSRESETVAEQGRPLDEAAGIPSLGFLVGIFLRQRST